MPVVPLVIILILIIFSVMNRLSIHFDKTTKEEVINLLKAVLNGTDKDYDWDDFVSCPKKDPALERIRLECIKLERNSKNKPKGRMFVDVWEDKLKVIIKELEELPLPKK